MSRAILVLNTTKGARIGKQSNTVTGDALLLQSRDSLNQHPQRSPRAPEGHRRISNGEQHHGSPNPNKTGDKPKRDSHTPKATETTPTFIKSVPSLPPKPNTAVESHALKLPDDHATSVLLNSPRLSEANIRGIDGNRDRNRDHSSSTARNGTKSESSVPEDVNADERPTKRFRRTSRDPDRDRSRSTSRYRDSDDLPPLDRQRSRSLQRRTSLSRSPRSRRSSVSSRSSDLNSLEAELLGVSARRLSTDSEPRRRPERIVPPKAKHRKPTNSAFR
ncbi:hypothetical protein BM221_009461 [Beauveria bassiana]|uniref:Uncharacterized protein n=1 Tax=Beauveria bassiana TaxID=176275 RepID=A0A2N6NBG4_BEABA|nr:hypothetical protein BM221_009461 [Beauveria bassiana]